MGLCKGLKIRWKATDDDDDEGDLMMRILKERAKKRMDSERKNLSRKLSKRMRRNGKSND